MKLILYHGTDLESAISIKNTSFIFNPNPCHWLGNGIYFFTDKALAKWWTTNPTSKFGKIIKNPAILKTEINVDESNVLDLRKLDTYQKVAQEFNIFFTMLYIPYHKETISEKQIKCLFFDWYLIRHDNINMIIGDFFSLEQPYVKDDAKDFYNHTNLLYCETQVCLKEDCQNIIIEKEIEQL